MRPAAATERKQMVETHSRTFGFAHRTTDHSAPRRQRAVGLWHVLFCVGLMLGLLPASVHAAAAPPATFRTLPALSFTKAYAGGDPLPQVITAASTGAAFNFAAVASTSSGGSWLSVTPAGCCATTPQAITVSANPDIALASGTYDGQITLKSTDGTQTMIIPVSLTVAPASAAFFDSAAGALTFSMKTAGSGPPAQALPVRNGGSGMLDFTASTSTADGGHWLKLSAQSGSAPSTVNVTVDPSQLPESGLVAGTFVGQVVLHTTGETATVPVTFSVGTAVFQQLNPLFFTKTFEGGDPTPQVVTVSSAGAAFNFAGVAFNSTGGNWLSISPAGCCSTTPNAVTVSANPDITLAAGTYTAEIVFKSTDGTMSSVVPVSMLIAPPSASFFDELAGELTFSLITKGSAPPAQTLQIRNAGSGDLNWTASASTADGGSWLTLSAQSGTAPSTLDVGIDPAKLPGDGLVAGTFVGQVVLETDGDTVTVPITVSVGASVFRQLNPISFTKTFEGGDPPPQVVTVASTGAAFNFASVAVNSTGGDWLSISPAGCCSTTPQAVTLSANPDVTLAAGIYTAEVIFKSTDGTRNIVLPVSLTIASPSATFFDELAGELTFSLITKGNAPPAQTLQIRNAGAGTLNWTVISSTADGGSWLTLSAQSGTAPSTLDVGINPENLPGAGLVAGTFVGQVVLRTPGDTVTVPITVTVGASVFRQLNPLAFTKAYAGGDPLPQVLTMASTGSAFNFAAITVASTGGNWLSVSPAGCCATTPQTLRVSANPDITLAAGTYFAEIIIKSTDGTQASVVTVTLTVAPPSATFFDSVVGGLTFSMPTAGAAPPALPIQVRNAGAGTLNFTASATTADGGSWLTLGTQGGTAPATLGISVDPSLLPGAGLVPGTFVGQVVLVTSSDRVTIPVTFKVGTSVFQPLSPLSFSKAFEGTNPATQAVTVASTGAAFNFSSIAINSTGGNWLSISPAGCCSTTPQAVKVAVNPDVTLASGTYIAQIVFTSTDGTQASVVPVTLTVGGGTQATPSPTFSPGTGSYTAAQSVTISDTSAGATIYYTTDGSAPTTNSPQYSGQITLSANQTLRAAAIASGDTLSSVATATYTFIPATVAPGSLTFSSQTIGTTSPVKTITLTNPGANALPAFSVSLSGSNAADFAFVGSGCDQTIPAGAGCTVSVTFSPHAAGARSATLGIAYTGIGSPLTVALSGSGTAATTSVILTPSLATPTYGQSLSLSAVLAGSPAPTGNLSYTVDNGTSKTAALSGGTASIQLGVLAAGSHTVTATYTGDTLYGRATQTITFNVAQAPLTATAASLSRQYGAANPALTYNVTGFVNADTAGVLTGSASLSTTAAATSNVGTYPITFATQALSAANYTFTYKSGLLTVTPASQTITFAAIPDQVYGGTLQLSATAGSGLPVAYSVSGPATLAGSTLTFTGTGSVSVIASQPGTSNYTAATPVTRSIVVSPANQTISFTGLPTSATYGSAGPYILNAAATSGLPVTYTVSGPAALSGSALTITGTGSVAVTASQPGNTNYSPAGPVTQTIVVMAAANGTVQLFATASLTRQPDGGYQVTITITNSGSGTANNVVLTGFTFGAIAGTPTPQPLNSIAPGSQAVATLFLPPGAGTSGTRGRERIAGTYLGATFGSSFRATLP